MSLIGNICNFELSLIDVRNQYEGSQNLTSLNVLRSSRGFFISNWQYPLVDMPNMSLAHAPPTVGTIVVCILPHGGCNYVQIISSMIVLAHDILNTSMNSKNLPCPCHLCHLHNFPFASNVKYFCCPRLIFQTMWLLHFVSLGLILCHQCLPLKSHSTLPFVLMPILFLLD